MALRRPVLPVVVAALVLWALSASLPQQQSFVGQRQGSGKRADTPVEAPSRTRTPSTLAGGPRVASTAAVTRHFFGGQPAPEKPPPPPEPERVAPAERDIFDSPLFGIIAIGIVLLPFIIQGSSDDVPAGLETIKEQAVLERAALTE
eukprot:CAMPEP_0175704224 /NCGR_PEP_ID=MMETSP0097-20121207/36916_1 /TAXON_ID=311494 /ORGANISM="Alexandrium monilatum, Strain CCMP3105" /LENGTH=146 /DNA_ID=CAMNT_0017011525 /DNA_START=15 /DNA_END=455 /DNA_ORIENTATION=-